jgi:hypothetical protein
MAGVLAIGAGGLLGCQARTQTQTQTQSETVFALWQPSPADAPAPSTPPSAPEDGQQGQEPQLVEVTEAMRREAVRIAIGRLLEMEEGEGRGEWPYEGVYRVRRQIPVGYRVGGTAIVCEALINAEGWADDDPRAAERLETVRRGIGFVLGAREHPLMSPDYDGGYDVRGWGYTTALSMLVAAANDDRFEVAAAPAEHEAEHTAEKDTLRDGVEWYIRAIEQTAIPQVGGWNYARRPGIETVSPPSSFMTAMTILALLDAREAGFAVDQGVLDKAVAFLESSRAESGEYVYSGSAAQRRPGGVPGATGRMVISELALQRVGRGDSGRVRAALDAFVEHWDELEKRRAKPGTHEPPYGVAPYYFYFAHRYAAEVIETLPEAERAERRAQVLGLLWKTRNAEDGTWNDRVFPRSASYGTAMSVLAILSRERAAE